MIKKINKKILFRASLAISSFLGLFIGVANSDRNLDELIISGLDVPIGSVELAFASGAGGCSGGSCGSDGGYPSTESGVGIIYQR
jgi:hypothetical protein